MMPEAPLPETTNENSRRKHIGAPHLHFSKSRSGCFTGPVIRFQGDVTVVELPPQVGQGRHGLHVWTEISHLLRSEPRVVLDLSQVPSFDRTAFCGLTRCLRRMVERNTAFVLCAVHPDVTEMLDFVGLKGRVRIKPSVSQAVTVFAPETN